MYFLRILLAAIFLRLAFAPFDLFPLAIAGIGILISQIYSQDVSTKNRYWSFYGGGLVFWLSMTWFIAYPHPATSLGWIALSGYLAGYWVLFALFCRLSLSARVPLWLSAPVIWTALEFVQAHMISGYAMGQLALTVSQVPQLIQIAEFTGSYGVSFALVWMAAMFTETFRLPTHRLMFVPALAILAGLYYYGHVRLEQIDEEIQANINQQNMEIPYQTLIPYLDKPDNLLRVALTQGNVECKVAADPDLVTKTLEQYVPLTDQARAAVPAPDAIVWPECMFRYPLYTIGETPLTTPGQHDSDNQPTDQPTDSADTTKTELTDETDANYVILLAEKFQTYLSDYAQLTKSYFITGIDRLYLGKDKEVRYNSVVSVSPSGEISPPYDKRHLVLFGEYIPFAEWLQFLQSITPVGQGSGAGKDVQVFTVTPRAWRRLAEVHSEIKAPQWQILPSICYENTLPHVIVDQLIEAREQGFEPDVLLNVSNDAWFRGTFEIDLRLSCSIFRSVELRKTGILSGNGGFSAQIDPCGRIVTQGKRLPITGWRKYFLSGVEPQVVNAEIPRYSQTSFYSQNRDWFSVLCLIVTSIIGIVGLNIPHNPYNPCEDSEIGEKLIK